MDTSKIEISLITPMYNEEGSLATSVKNLLDQLEKIGKPYELILVNDGSQDNSLSIAQQLAAKHPTLRLLSYKKNCGRGKALRTGFAAAQGKYIITTESDSSWGDDIVSRLYHAITNDPETDMVIASPHLPGGGYKNVPAYRVFLSSFGNIFLRQTFYRKITMTTGMTRAYKQKVIRSLLLTSDRKEIHLEILSKALTLAFRVTEIPATLTWKSSAGRQKRGSLVNIFKLIISHLLFGANEKPTLVIGILGLLSLLGGGVAFGINIYGHIIYELSEKLTPFKAFPSATLITLLILLGILLMLFTFVTMQNRNIQSDLIRLQAMLLTARKADDE